MSRVMKTMVSFLVIVLLGGGIAFAVIFMMDEGEGESQEPTVDDIVRFSYETPEITTDLEDGSFVRIQFQVVTNGRKALEEIEKRDFQLKNILIKELATMDEEFFTTELDVLEEQLVDQLNELMTTGNITEVYTIHKILQ